ncbi:MAG: replication protein, partial [Oscillospiraceae bacterium]|nr:replication protein [Oscillospiraceae bacterium]
SRGLGDVDKSQADIQTINGFDIREFVELTKSEVVKAKREVLQLIRDNGLTEYADLIDILMDGGESTADMFDVASSNTLFFKAYLTSQWRRRNLEA